jgi:hypothetical protein
LTQGAKKTAARGLAFLWQPEGDLLFNGVLKDFHRLHKAAVSHGDHHINGIEVFSAVEAPGQICPVVGGRMKIAA